jgi:hypothetical protein
VAGATGTVGRRALGAYPMVVDREQVLAAVAEVNDVVSHRS